MKNILFIVGSYYPKPSANGVCVHEIAKELRNRGVNVTIVANRSVGMELEESIDGVQVYRVKKGLLDRTYEWGIQRKDNKLGKAFQAIIKFINRFKLLMSFPFWPLKSPVHTLKIYLKIKRLHKSNKYDGVISVYNPIEGLLASILLKKKYPDLNLMYYFLDSISSGISPRPFSRGWLLKRGWKWEKFLFSQANSIFIIESHKNHFLKNKYRQYHNKIHFVDIPLVRNINKLLNTELYKDSQRIKLVFTGSLFKNVRNPWYFIELFTKLNEDHLYEMYFYGNSDYKPLINNTDLISNGIIYGGVLSVEESYTKMIQADFLVNIGNETDYLIPSKIFEYISMGKPILSTCKTEDDPSIYYLEKYPLGLLIMEDEVIFDENVSKMKSFIDSNINKSVEIKEVKEIFINNTPLPMTDIILNELGS